MAIVAQRPAKILTINMINARHAIAGNPLAVLVTAKG